MKTLREYIEEARQHTIAIGHFNFGLITMFHGIMDAAWECSKELDHPYEGGKIPIILGVSEGDRKTFGAMEAVTLVQMMREKYDYPVFINADHTHEVATVKESIDMGYDMVIYDGVTLSYEENMKNTRSVVEYKNKHNPNCLVEAELGFIGSSSSVHGEIPEGVGPETMTDPQMARDFISETGIDAIAPSVGNVHGIILSGNPPLDIDHIAKLRLTFDEYIVLHGGSGISDQDFRRAIAAGIDIIHVSTDIRRAYRMALEQALLENKSVSPDTYISPCRLAIKEVVKGKIKLLTNV